MKKDEQAVQDLQACLTDFDADPFDESKPTLRSLQSGLVASPELVTDQNSPSRWSNSFFEVQASHGNNPQE
jgi:hypothetical protein